MKTRNLILILCCIAFSARGDEVTLWSDFDTPDSFVTAISGVKPSKSANDLASLFVMRDMGQLEDPKTGKPVKAEAIESCKTLWKDEASALVFATASPATEATRSAVGVLFLLKRVHGRFHIVDHKRFTATGKYAGVSVEVTAARETGGGGPEERILTIKESHGGRGYSYQLSATYTFKENRLIRMELE